MKIDMTSKAMKAACHPLSFSYWVGVGLMTMGTSLTLASITPVFFMLGGGVLLWTIIIAIAQHEFKDC